MAAAQSNAHITSSVKAKGNSVFSYTMACPVQHNIHTGEKPSGTIKAGDEGKSAPGTYIRWDEKGVEVEQPGEKEKIQEVSDQFYRFQMMNVSETKHFFVLRRSWLSNLSWAVQ